METSAYILIGLGAGIIIFVGIFLLVRSNIERKKQAKVSAKDVTERSFTNSSVRSFPLVTEYHLCRE